MRPGLTFLVSAALLFSATGSRAGDAGKLKVGVEKLKGMIKNLTPEQIEQGKKGLQALVGIKTSSKTETGLPPASTDNADKPLKKETKPAAPADAADAKKKLDELGIPLYKGLSLDALTEGPERYELKYSMPAKDGGVFKSMTAFYKTELPKKFLKKGWKAEGARTDRLW